MTEQTSTYWAERGKRLKAEREAKATTAKSQPPPALPAPPMPALPAKTN